MEISCFTEFPIGERSHQTETEFENTSKLRKMFLTENSWIERKSKLKSKVSSKVTEKIRESKTSQNLTVSKWEKNSSNDSASKQTEEKRRWAEFKSTNIIAIAQLNRI